MAQHYQARHAAQPGKPPRAPRNTEPSRAADAPHTSRAAEEAYDEYEAPKRRSKGPLIVLLVILIVAVLGGGFYALVHFGVISLPAESTEAPTDSFVVPTLTPTPSVVPTEAPTEPDYVAMAEKTASSMTDREKFLQLIITTPETLTGVDAVNMAGETTKNALETYPVGGVIYSDVNLETVDQTKELLSKSQSYARIPLFLAVDEEGGDVARVASKLGTKSFDSMYSYKDMGIQTAHDNAMDIASDLSSLGFNLNFAPVADTLTDPSNTAIGERAYSDNYADAARLVASAVTGFHSGGVLCTLKHFPGHGAAPEDSHTELAHIDKTADELLADDMVPFKNGIDAGADMVMVGHLVVTHMDDELPATLSPSVVPKLLRELLRYDGVVITDSMQMGAIADNFSHETIVKGIFDADIDMILMPDDLDSCLESFEKLLAEGSITREQLDKKVIRVLSLKYQKGIIPTASENPSEAPSEPAANAVTETAAVQDETLSPAA